MGLIQSGYGATRPLVVWYWMGNDTLKAQVSPSSCIVIAQKPFTSFHKDNLRLDELKKFYRGITGAEKFSPVLLAGFSAGCSAVRNQLLHGQYPSATLTVDGVHASKPVQEWQLAPWRTWYAKCGAQLNKPPGSVGKKPYKPIAWLTCTQIMPPTYSGTLATARAITGWDIEAGSSPTSPNAYKSGNLAIWAYPGGTAATHIDQGQRVLPNRMRDMATALGFGPKGGKPYIKPKGTKPKKKPPKGGKKPSTTEPSTAGPIIAGGLVLVASGAVLRYYGVI